MLPGQYQVHVRCDDHVPEDCYDPITVGESAPAELEWKVHKGRSIRGTVLDHDGHAVAELQVFVS